jgi:hypothetical protein
VGRSSATETGGQVDRVTTRETRLGRPSDAGDRPWLTISRSVWVVSGARHLSAILYTRIENDIHQYKEVFDSTVLIRGCKRAAKSGGPPKRPVGGY